MYIIYINSLFNNDESYSGKVLQFTLNQMYEYIHDYYLSCGEEFRYDINIIRNI